MSINERRYPVNTPLLTKQDAEVVSQSILDNWVSSEGPSVREFEVKFSELVDRKHGVAVANGTAALDICIETLNLQPGDEVIVPSFSIISTINAILRSGGKPVFVDCQPNDYNCAVEAIVERMTSKTKAVIFAHIYCFSVDLKPLEKICSEKGIVLIEDAAELFGTPVAQRVVGSFGDLSIVSFYPNKFITTGEGGMILTNSLALRNKAVRLRNLGFDPENRFYHTSIGFNYRMTNLQAALGLSQLQRIDKQIEKKRQIGLWYAEALKEEKRVSMPSSQNNDQLNYYWVVPFHISPKYNTKTLAKNLANRGVGTRPMFYPLNLQPVLGKYGWNVVDDCPNARSIYQTGLYLPNGLDLTKSDICEISQRLQDAMDDLSVH